jgi:lipoprotein-anchoring transpeptidase ErfK/SrfK
VSAKTNTDIAIGILGNTRVSGFRISTASVAVILAAAGVIAGASEAEAALYYWNDYDPGYYRPTHPIQPRRQKVRRNAGEKNGKKQAVEKETGAKPQGPLIISISIDQQKVRVYDSNGLFAEGPVSTGMKGHPTPMGVFSVIQKHRMHHSNIYSGAPMPYMQRITWSGIAMHAGVLPGYPASHGCIRMPTAFAVKMWNWTKMGARVLVTPGAMTPAPFSHPLLVTQKVTPQPMADEAPKVDAPLGVKSDKGADASGEIGKSADTADAKLELRSTVGHARTQTADAGSALPANAAVAMSDATPATASGEGALVKVVDNGEPAAKTQAAGAEAAKPEATKVEPVPAKTAGASDEKPAEAKPAEAVTGEIKPGPAADPGDAKADASASAKAGDRTVEPKADTAAEAKLAAPKVELVKPEIVKSEPAKAEEPKADATAVAKPVDPAKAVSEAPAAKDPSRLPGQEKAKPELKREGQVAVFISRKDGKIYVRQNFKPVFEAPVVIAPSEKLLGTHVFTAEVDKSDTNLLRWSAVSLPVTARNAQKIDDDARPSRRRKGVVTAPAETKAVPAPNTPAEALDRITIPPDVMATIAEALTTGGSIVVSDQGINQGETGEGTDFIVRLR